MIPVSLHRLFRQINEACRLLANQDKKTKPLLLLYSSQKVKKPLFCKRERKVKKKMKSSVVSFGLISLAGAFAPTEFPQQRQQSSLFMAEADAKAPQVNGEELELMLTEWDQPLVVDAYATWCGPCLLMAPEFEEAAKELDGKVRFVKLDTDAEETMASRLQIMGLPTLLFLDKFVPDEGAPEEEQAAKAVLKGKIEGALRKENIVDLCNFFFFGGPEPKMM